MKVVEGESDYLIHPSTTPFLFSSASSYVQNSTMYSRFTYFARPIFRLDSLLSTFEDSRTVLTIIVATDRPVENTGLNIAMISPGNLFFLCLTSLASPPFPRRYGILVRP